MENYRVTCCCCIPIRTGVWILAILGLIGSISYIINGGLLLISGGQVDTHGAKGDDGTIAMGQACLTLGLGILNLLLTVLLINGLNEGMPRKLLIWVKINLAILVLGTLANVLLLIVAMISLGSGVGFETEIVAFLVMGLIAIWQGYYIWVVDKYARIMEGEDDCVPIAH